MANNQKIIDSACSWAIKIANNNSHGYNNKGDGWGKNGDYNCIGLVMTAFNQAGLNVGSCQIFNMPGRLLSKGFKEITKSVNFKTGAGLKKGDVVFYLDKTGKHGHVELFIGNGKLVGARADYDGRRGDSSGNEIAVIKYMNMGWQRAFRLPVAPTPAPAPDPVKYKVGTGWKDGKCVNQHGAFSNLDNAKKNATVAMKDNKKTYYVFDLKGNKVYTATYNKPATPTTVYTKFTVFAGSFTVKANAEKVHKKLSSAGIANFIKVEENYYIVQAGVFSKEENANEMVKKIKALGINARVEKS